jgi:hypothetical protein
VQRLHIEYCGVIHGLGSCDGGGYQFELSEGVLIEKRREDKQDTTTNLLLKNVSRYYRLIPNTTWILRLLDIYF